MDFKANGINISIDPAELSNDQLAQATQEFAVAAQERGLEIPAFAGSVAVEAASESKVDPADIKEALTGQLDTSFKGYLSQVEQINKNRSEEDKIEAGDAETLTTEFEAWFSEDRQANMAEAMEVDPELTFTLCAVANETVTPDEIIEDAREFGKEQPYKTTVYPEVITQYTPEEVSGTNPENGKKFKFVAIPSKFTPELFGKVKAQQDTLAELKKDAPFLEAPTPLVGMTFLHTRRAMGDKLVGDGTANKTYMRSYGMEDKPFGRYRCVPSLVVLDYGKLVVDYSDVQRDSVGFALVG